MSFMQENKGKRMSSGLKLGVGATVPATGAFRPSKISSSPMISSHGIDALMESINKILWSDSVESSHHNETIGSDSGKAPRKKSAKHRLAIF